MLQSYDDVTDWLCNDAPADLAGVTRAVVNFFAKDRHGGGGSPGSKAASILRSYWLPRFPHVDFEDVLEAVRVAAEEAAEASEAAKVERQARIKEGEHRRLKERHRQRLLEEKLRRDREERAEKAKR